MFVTEKFSTKMKWIKSVFIMGEPGFETSKSGAERPCKVKVSAFYIGKTEVLQGEWIKVMQKNPSLVINEKMPVENVSWYDAAVYCNRRSFMEGLRPCYSIAGECDPEYWGDLPAGDDTRWNSVMCNYEASGIRTTPQAINRTISGGIFE